MKMYKKAILLSLLTLSCEDTLNEPIEEDFWQHIALDGTRVTAIGVNSNDDLFFGTSEDNSKLYMMPNNSEDLIQLSWSGSWVEGIIFNRTDDIFAWNGLRISVDGGESWESGLYAPGLPNTYAIDQFDLLYAGGWSTNRLVQRSINNGISWESFCQGLPENNISISSIAFDSLGYIYIGTSGVNNTTNGLYKCHRDSIYWESIGLVNESVNTININSAGYIIAGTNNGVYISRSQGESWDPAGLVGESIEEIVTFGNKIIIAGIFYGAGVSISYNNGGKWESINTGLKKPIAVRSLNINSDNYAFLGTYYGGLYKSKNPVID